MTEGQAAGTAAALAIALGHDLRDLDIGRLQNSLRADCAELRDTLVPVDDDLVERIGVIS